MGNAGATTEPAHRRGAGGGDRAGDSAGTMGRQVELEGQRVVYQAVDRRVGGHLVAEDPVPLAERQVAGHHHRAPSYWSLVEAEPRFRRVVQRVGRCRPLEARQRDFTVGAAHA